MKAAAGEKAKAKTDTLQFQVLPGEGAVIAEAMNDHAKALAKAKETTAAAKSDAIEEGDEDEEEEEDDDDDEDEQGEEPEAGSPELNGWYRAENPILVRAGIDLETEQSGMLEKDEMINVTASGALASGQIRLQFATGWISLKPHLVKRVKDYTPPETPEESTVSALRQVITMFAQCGKADALAAELKAIWAAEFGDGGSGSHDAAAAKVDVILEDDGAGVSDSGSDALRAETVVKEAALAEVAGLKEEVANLTTAKEAAEAKVAELQGSVDDEISAGAAELEAAQKAAKASEDQVVALTEEVATLKAALETAESQAAPAGRVAAPKSAMPADAQGLFDKAKVADNSGDKAAALAAYQTGVKTAMAYLQSHPAAKAEVTPVLQGIMKRAQELKKELAADAAPAPAPAPASASSDLPENLEAMFAAAKAADREGNEKEAISLYEGAAKSAMVFIRTPEGAAQKGALAPTLQKFIGRARELKQKIAA